MIISKYYGFPWIEPGWYFYGLMGVLTYIPILKVNKAK
jgi:hypothetical protein